jgi:hypothetical protein
MESVDEYVKQKIGVKDMRNEIKGMKEKIFKNTAVMRQGELNAYLDKLRYVNNLINAEDAMGNNPKKFLKDEHKELNEKTSMEHKKKKDDSESESDSSSDDEKPMREKKEKPVKGDDKKKEKHEIEMVKKDIKKEMKSPSKEKTAKMHKDEMKHLKELEKHLESIPKPMHSSYKKHLKVHDGDHEKARKALKKEMKL